MTDPLLMSNAANKLVVPLMPGPLQRIHHGVQLAGIELLGSGPQRQQPVHRPIPFGQLHQQIDQRRLLEAVEGGAESDRVPPRLARRWLGGRRLESRQADRDGMLAEVALLPHGQEQPPFSRPRLFDNRT